ncbi:hypothetical protein [Chryseobacterium pennipullorum]|uniref:DUF8202 domain-containing protein n=1 Tax=Chryseobacterium pennipullorum TaxID=2258963 RepID=A0A3D9B9E3_9FLAO|nr:hypothetical protein [Chryseobacterium pennipullorum]REC50305.1 hypothetical protein DRF67_01900 [Chryseobacterium pennipullorum]
MKKKVYRLVITLMGSFGAYAQAPGGVQTDLRIWLKSDSGFTPSQWTDQSTAGNDYTQTNASRQPSLQPATAKFNFNPVVDFGTTGADARFMVVPSGKPFTANRLNGNIFVLVNRNSDSSFRDYLGFGATGTGTGLIQANYPVLTASSTGNKTMQLYPYASPANTFNQKLDIGKTYLSDVSWEVGVSNGIKYGLNSYVATSSGTFAAGYALTANGSVLGAQPEVTDGYIPEVIAYERVLTDSETQRVRSYLAIKYATSLDQTTPYHYVNSQGTIIWDATLNSQYAKNIAGIGRDDASALKQVQSKSINSTNEMLISLGNVASQDNATHAANYSFDNDHEFLMWGSNGILGFTEYTNANFPLVTHRFSKVWKAQTSNYNVTGTDDVYFNILKGLINSFNLSGKPTYLIMSTTPDFSGNNHFIPIGANVNTVDGEEYVSAAYQAASNAFSGFTSNGTFYFTIAGTPVGPGGVLGVFWNRADKEVTAPSGTVNQWVDQMFGIKSSQVADVTTMPAYISVNNAATAANFNFNPYLDFTATNQTLGNESVAPFEGSTSELEMFYVIKDNVWTANNRFFGVNFDLNNSASGQFIYDWNALHQANYYSRGNTSNSGIMTNTVLNPALSTTLSNISNVSLSAVDGTVQHRLNGSAIGTNLTGQTVYIGQGGFVYGANNQSSMSGNDVGVTAQIAEHIAFGNALTGTQRRQVETYLAIKYGTTLTDLTADAHYRNSSGASIFNADATYRYDIFGIAKDLTGGLDQRISKSINNDGGQPTPLITVSTDKDFINQNNTHANLLTDGQYMVFASNNGAQTFTGSAITAVDGTAFNTPLGARWKATDTNGVGCVNLRFDATNIPALAAGESYYMLISKDESFTNPIYQRVLRTGSTIDAAANFTDNANSYFTLAKANLQISGSTVSGGQIGISSIPGWTPSASDSWLELNARSKGMVIPRISSVNNIPAGDWVKGMFIYDTTEKAFKVYNGTEWRRLGTTSGSVFCN